LARCSDGCRGGSPSPWNPRLDVAAGSVSPQPLGTKWLLRGITSNERYVVREERIVSWRSSQVWVEQGHLCRPDPYPEKPLMVGTGSRRTPEDFEEQSRHSHWAPISPCCGPSSPPLWDLGESEPFDFLTWFEYSPSDEPGFNRLLAELRASVGGSMSTEIDIRLVHEPA
jgi:hypothetical protein